MKSPVAMLMIISMIAGFVSCKKSSPHVPTNYVLILRPDSTTGQDAYVSKLDNTPTDGNANTNNLDEILMARWTFDWANYDSAIQRSYIRFDSLSKIPTNATVASATLYLYGEPSSYSFPGVGDSYYPGSANPPNPGVLEAVTGPWDQKTITFNNAPAASADIQDTIPASTSQYNYNAQIDVTNLVKPMVATPSKNNGFMMKLITEHIYRAMEFYSCEAPDSTKRPMLVVHYSN